MECHRFTDMMQTQMNWFMALNKAHDSPIVIVALFGNCLIKSLLPFSLPVVVVVVVVLSPK